MKTMILNELDFAREVIRTRDLGKSPMFALVCAGRYYAAQGFGEDEIYQKLRAIASQDGRLNWSSVAEHVLSACKRRSLLEVPYIPVTQSEFSTIQALDGLQRQRLLFALLTLAKYGNLIKSHNDNWVRYEPRDVFKLANVNVARHKQSLYINDLMCAGVVQYSDHVDNLDLRVLMLDDAAPAAAAVHDMRNLGFQYMMHIGLPFFECTSCGVVAKRTAGKQKYCTECAAVINAQKTIERYHAKHRMAC